MLCTTVTGTVAVMVIEINVSSLVATLVRYSVYGMGVTLILVQFAVSVVTLVSKRLAVEVRNTTEGSTVVVCQDGTSTEAVAIDR